MNGIRKKPFQTIFFELTAFLVLEVRVFSGQASKTSRLGHFHCKHLQNTHKSFKSAESCFEKTKNKNSKEWKILITKPKMDG